ncbi:MAG: hypothetical protein K6F99_06075 [Lachnospiraceae bacterium]|nr:hypothetical protein [Lachnospiraceae bacterium]
MKSAVKKVVSVIVVLAMTIAMTVSVYAAKSTPRGVKGTWVPISNGVAGYLLPNGSYLQDGFTADGYYVGKTGMWASSVRILSAWVPVRNSWCRRSSIQDMTGFLPWMNSAQQKLSDNLHGYRVLSLYSNRITLSSVKKDKEYKKTKTIRLAMYENEDIDGYTIQVSTPLAGDVKDMPSGGAGEWDSMEYYDYQVLRLFTNCISRSGDLLATSIYSSWQDDNAYDLRMNKWVTVGDTQVRYIPSAGAGLYEVKAAF